MRNNTLLTISMLLAVILLPGCKEDDESVTVCQEITLNEPFIAKVGETWCRSSENWKVTLGPVIDDGRCNIPDILCVWEGAFLLSAEFHNGEIVRDTFLAVGAWQDTLYNGAFTIKLTKVFPETRTSFDMLDQDAYSFEIIVK